MPLNRMRMWRETRAVRSIELASRRSALLRSYYHGDGDVPFHCDEANQRAQ